MKRAFKESAWKPREKENNREQEDKQNRYQRYKQPHVPYVTSTLNNTHCYVI